MRVLETTTTEVWHRIGLAPYDVVQKPEANVLKLCANAENIVVRTNNPDSAIWLQHATAGQKPCAGEGIIGLKAFKLIPMIVNSANHRLIRAVKIATELEIVRRIGKNDVHRVIRKAFQCGNAITLDDRVEPSGTRGLNRQLMCKTY